jgi:F0F1-type ATP synthase gamma subunit
VHALKPQRPLPLTYLEPVFILNKALEELLYISLYRGFIESLRSENWYRLRSMEGAAESLKGRISDLNSLQKYIRQEEITEEMLEILGSGMFYR